MRKICKVCERFFESEASDICEECTDYKNICQDYIRTHHNSSIAEINLATGIKIKTVKKLIEAKYLNFK